MARLVYFRGGSPVYAPSDAKVITHSGHAKPHIQLGGVEFKHCPRCNTWKKLTRFHVSVNAWDGLQDMCTSCREEANFERLEAKRKRKPGSFKWFEKVH
jgi:hypothetical protein